MEILILFKAFILGLVEGATEFIPVSSTGHLIIAGDLLNFNDERGKVFEIVIQLGAILAVCWQYRERWLEKISGFFVNTSHLVNVEKWDGQKWQAVLEAGRNDSVKFFINLFIAFMPAAIFGLAFHHAIKEYLFSPITVAIALITGGIAILFIEKRLPVADTQSVDDMDWKHALKVGFAQCLALFPGVSRSGATIMGGLLFGLSRKTATEFSFFLAVPIMVAATILDVYKSGGLLSKDDIGIFAVGFITAFVSALIAIRVLIRYVAQHDFKAFAWYRIAFGIVVLAYYLY